MCIQYKKNLNALNIFLKIKNLNSKSKIFKIIKIWKYFIKKLFKEHYDSIYIYFKFIFIAILMNDNELHISITYFY